METFTFTFRPTTKSAEIKRIQFKSNCFFGAAAKFLRFCLDNHPDFILLQIRDQLGAELYDTGLRPERLA